MPEIEDNPRGDFPVPGARLEGTQFVTPGLQAGSPPEQARLPSLDGLKKLSLTELQNLLEYYGVQAPWGTLVTRNQDYVTRMTEYRPGSPQWQAAVDALLDRESKRGALSMNRRVAQTWSSLDSIDGNVNQEMIWLTEGVVDEDVCENCEANAGKIKTWAQWQVDGPPGAAVCLGGDYCRCDLIVIE
jgi:hypothetical protein